MHTPLRRLLALLAAATLVTAACGGDDDTSSSTGGDLPTVAVTTNILGDVVERLAGGTVEVMALMPVGADPHDFQLSARQVNELREADLLITNGGSFEAGLHDVIESATADGVPAFEALSAVETLEFHGEEEDGHEDGHAEDEHSEDDHEGHEEDEHAHDGADPHFFTDPARMAVAVRALADELLEQVDGLDASTVNEATDAYVSQLEALAAEVDEILAPVAADDRVMVTNHDVFGYFADAYDFRIIGTVIPSGTTADATSAADLTALAETIEDADVPAVFTDASAAGGLLDALVSEVGDIEVVELFTESLGDDGSGGETYVDMVRTNAERIAEALS